MFLEVDHLRIHYKVMGQGQPIVLLHGWGCSLKVFETIQSLLSRSYQVYALDLPGFGMSSIPDKPWGTEDYEGLVSAFLKELAIKQPIVLGHSLGGRIAICLASKSQALIKKLILVNSAGIKPKRKLKFYFRVYVFKALKWIMQLPILNSFFQSRVEAYKKRFGSADYKQASGVVRDSLVKVVNEDLQGLLPTIKIATLLVWGENDHETPLSAGKIMQAALPNATLVVLKNAGHYCFKTNQENFMSVLAHFLKEEE